MSLATIRQSAMDFVDEQSNTSSGKFSLAWWLRRINETVAVVAHETGFNVTTQSVAFVAGQQSAALPATLCHAVFAAQWGVDKLDTAENNNVGMYKPSAVLNGALPAASTLIGNYPVGSTGLELADASAFPASGAVNVDGEIISYASKTDNTLDCTATTQSHADGASVSIATITLVSTTGFPTDGGTVGIDTDVVTYAAVSGYTLTGCSGVTNAHLDGAKVTMAVLGTPDKCLIKNPTIYLDPIPDTAGTVYLLAGALPTALSSDSDTITGLPSQFERVISYGAAALSEVSDLYAQPQAGRAQAYVDGFWAGVESIKAYLNTLAGGDARLVVNSPHRASLSTDTCTEVSWD